MKELYSYTLNKESKSEVKVKHDDGTYSTEFEIIKTPITVVLKSPSRQDRNQMSIAYSAELHKCLAAGISSESMIRRAVLDGGGGYMPKYDIEQLHLLWKEYNELSLQISTKRNESIDVTNEEEDLLGIYKKIYAIESSYNAIFDNCAEARAAKHSLTWAALYLTYTKEGEDKYTPVFLGPTFEMKLNIYYDMCDNEDKFAFELGCFDRSYVYVDRYINGDAENKEDFDKITVELNEFFKT